MAGRFRGRRFVGIVDIKILHETALLGVGLPDFRHGAAYRP